MSPPPSPRTTEGVFNAALGNVLRRKHPRWDGDRIGVEQTGVVEGEAGLRPDIIVRHPGGLPVSVETEFAPAGTLEKDACSRLGKKLARDGQRIEQAIALRIPERFSTASQNDIEGLIETESLEFCLLSGGDPQKSPGRWPEIGWIEGGINELADCIEHASLSEDRIARGMDILERCVEQTAEMLRESCADAPAPLEKIAAALHQADGTQTTRMAMAIVANALTFHISIVGTSSSRSEFVVDTLDALRNSRGQLPKGVLLKHWRSILTEINYWPIFKIASDMLIPIRNGTARNIIETLSVAAAELDSLGATSQHDLSGRMLQRLIADRKFLATFYTRPNSAALLAELAVARLGPDWGDEDAICSLRVADFACGTGALLNAAYGAMSARCRRNGLDDRELHPRIMESVLVGTDIMPAATHITASMLSGTHPRVSFQNTQIYTLPYGKPSDLSGRHIALGALDLIAEESMLPLFGTGQKRMRGDTDSVEENADLRHDTFDLVIMNPPFTRPTNHEGGHADVPVPSFAGFSTSEDEQQAMSRRLRSIRQPGMAGHGNAGLASNFMDIAHAKLKVDGGVLALVLPAAFVQGEAWAAARQMLRKHYRDITIVSIAAVGRSEQTAFSADTGMAEVLVLATRCEGGGGEPALFVNLRHRPHAMLEAVAVARVVRAILVGQSAGPVPLGTEDIAGCFVRAAFSEEGSPAGIRELSVARAATGLMRGELHLPRGVPAPLPLIDLGNLGRRGLVHRDISGSEITGSGLPRGPFEIVCIKSGDVPTYPALWSHDAPKETRLVVEQDRQGYVREGCDDHATKVWDSTASRLHFSLDFRINSQPLVVCMTVDPALGGRAWPSFICADRRWEIPLALWSNTIIGLMAFWWLGTRQQGGRANLTISKLPRLMTLDTRKLSPEQMKRASEIFDVFKDREFLPANEAWRDEARQALDRAMLIDLLGLPEDIMEPLGLLRRQWCAEPSVHGGKRTAPP